MLAVFFFLLFSASLSTAKPVTDKSGSSSSLPDHLLEEIHSYKDVATQIIDFYTKGEGRGQVWKRLALFVDTFGSRLAGTPHFEKAVGECVDLSQLFGGCHG